MTEPWSLEESYDAYPRIEEAFEQALDEGLAPRGPSLLFDLVAELGFPSGVVAVDVGCGEGGHALRLAERFGFDITGVDPVERHVASADAALADRPDLAHLVRFRSGTAETIPVPDDSVDLVWCVDVLSHVEDVGVAAAEVRRVLRPGGRALVFASMGTDRLEPAEGAWLWRVMGVVPRSADPVLVEAGFAAGGLTIEERHVIGSEWGEEIEERTGKAGRKLLHAARLQRDPERYVARFGPQAYEMMLADCHWTVDGMLGKLSRHVWLLSRA